MSEPSPTSEPSAWQRWESLTQGPHPDPLVVLGSVARFEKYFAAVEREAIKTARAQGRSWSEIGAALGRSRERVWRHAPSGEVAKLFEDASASNAEVRRRIGLNPI